LINSVEKAGMRSNILNNRYRLDKKIGEGGFAHVFLATDLLLGRQVAVKVMEASWIKDKELLARFHKEAQAIATLDHPNILQIYDFGVVKGAPYLVTPYISGGTLADLMKQSPFTLDEIGVYLDQIGSALDYAHQRGIVHRDIKPGNLLIRPNGQLVLMDFGLVKLLRNAALPEQTAIVGTVAYMAPEQYYGLVSAASDIYMLGVLLYEMLAGKLPFEGNTNAMVVGHVHLALGSLSDQPTMRPVPPDVVHALDLVLAKVLAKLPVDRYPTCQTLCSAYYTALNADPDRAAMSYPDRERRYAPSATHSPDLTGRYHSSDKQPAPRNLDKTILSDQPPIVQPAPVSPAPMRRLPDATLIDPPGKPSRPITPTPARGTFDATLIDPPSKLSGPVSPTPVLDSPNAMVIAPSTIQHKKVLLKPPRLLVTTEPDKVFRATFDLKGETVTLGRAKDNDLSLPLLIISRHHAVLKRLHSDLQEPSYKIVQLKSANPLFFKGKRVSEKVLEHGDTFEIGMRGLAKYMVKLTYLAAEYDSGDSL
jgi:serine/threonine protein kinase